jgi:hypothetical protein
MRARHLKNIRKVPIQPRKQLQPKPKRSYNVSKTSLQKSKANYVKLSKQKAEMIKRNHLRRLMELKQQNLKHRRATKELMRKSTLLGKKMMLAVQNIEKLPSAGKIMIYLT